MKITKKILGALLAFASSVAFATTLVPIQLLNPTGSTSGQVILSNGPSNPPSWGGISLSGLGAIAANTVVANVTGASAVPSAFGMPSCSSSTSALQWTSGTGFTCYGNSASLTGATFTGAISVAYSNPTFTVNDTSGANYSQIYFQNSASNVWNIQRSPSNVLNIGRFVSGTFSDNPISISNSTGLVTFADGISSNSSSNALTGGAINNASIGASTASTGAFTTLSANSTITGFIGRLINVQIFSSSGTYTPTTGTASVVITVQGSGGGGGGAATTTSGQTAAAGGGGSGSYAKARFTSGFAGGIAVTVPSGGAGGTAGANNGTAGSAASIGSLISCPGGMAGAGAAAATSAGYVAGSGRSATCTITGAAETLANLGGNVGLYGIVLSSTSSLSGAGGNSLLGDAGGQTVGNNAGLAGAGCGSGGSGGVTTVGSAVAGGNGAAACVEVDEYSN